MKTGLFFGSFNPVHIGHTVIAGYMAEFAGLDEVWMVVSPQNPLKLKASLLPNHHRYELVRIASEVHPAIKPSNIEFNMPRPSFTIDTLAHLKEKYPGKDFALIMGSDNLATLARWKNYERILSQHHLMVYPRPGFLETPFNNHPSVTITGTPLMEISATFIRDALKAKKNIRFLFPPGVYEYIREMHFYEKKLNP